MIAWLYLLIDPRDDAVRYVGWTTRSLTRRLTEHCCPNRVDRSYRANWIRKLKRLGLRPTIQHVVQVVVADAPVTEIQLIAKYRAAGCRLTNGTDGGDGTLGYKHPPDAFDRSHWPAVITTYRRLKSVRSTAEATGISKTGVEYILKARHIKLFPGIREGYENSSHKSILSGSPSALVRDYGVMHRLYEVERLSTTEIGRELGVAANTVLTGLRQCNIPLRSHRDAARGRPWQLRREYHQ